LPALGLRPIRSFVASLIEKRVHGPSQESLARDGSSLWGCVEDGVGSRVTATLTTPNGYALTVSTALAAVERLLATAPAPGFLTPSRAFGADFIDTIPGCDFRFEERTEEPAG
jgi:short subunit dehydrogenase-like uncharacterized protein